MGVKWRERERRALRRTSQSQECCICYNFFSDAKEGKQVITSCCHLFHTSCLLSFEQHLGESKRFCPICRLENYEKQSTCVGSKAFRQYVAAKTIILFWRRYKRHRIRDYRLNHNAVYELRQQSSTPYNLANDSASQRSENTDRVLENTPPRSPRVLKASKQ